MKHCMVDMETLGTAADSVILSIGAVRFDLDSGRIDDDGFYQSISVESNLGQDRHISEDTLKWWMQQPKEAQKVFFEPKVSLTEALADFSSWLKDDKKILMWSNGADFDLPMLAHAYTQAKWPVPWAYFNSRCFRTYKNLPGAKNIRPPAIGVAHNALADAFHQAQTLIDIHQALFSKGQK